MYLKNVKIGALISFSLFLFASCINDYGGCKPKQCEVRVRTHSGWVCGRMRRADDGTPYASFRGMPYAKPPLRERRFQELEPVEPWDGLFDATEDPPACPQSAFTFGRILLQTKGQSEDCIYLNLHVPHAHLPKSPYSQVKEPLPVLVFIHGGVLQGGSGLTDFYGPEYFMARPVVVITFNYRLNVFGFLSLNTKEIPGNQGLRDIVTLLKWVQRNVHAFGGDPNNVTLMGQSIGATLAHFISFSKTAKGLFERLILLSGTAYPSYFTTSTQYAKDIAGMFLQEVGINSTDPVYIHDQLIEMSLSKIIDANVALQYKTGFLSFNIVKESKFPGITSILEEHPLALIAQGRKRHIVTFTNNEFFFAKWLLTRKNFLGLLQRDPTAILEPRLAYSLPKDELSGITAKIFEKYFKEGTPTLQQLMAYYTDSIFKHSAFKMAQWRAAMGGAPMYMLEYSYEAEFSPIRSGLWVEYPGAAHMDDLASIFRVNSMMGDYITHPPKFKDDYMKVWMVDLITNFMTYGKPLGYDREGLWPAVARSRILYNEITEPNEVLMKGPTSEQVDMVEFFDSFDPEVRNITTFLGAGWN